MLPTDTSGVLPENSPRGDTLDSEIASLKAQIESLKTQRAIQAASIISSHATQSTLNRLRAAQQPDPTHLPNDTELPDIPTTTNPLLAASAAQLSHNQQNLYRACASVTAFRIRDPDPYAVDSGHVLALRIDLSTTGKYIKPYHVMLNKPFEGEDKQLLRIHRHTVPPCIPLASLADRYLPCGKGALAMGASAVARGKRQDLRMFVRALRREIAGYHNRISTIKSLRKEFKLDGKASRKHKGKDPERVIVNISAVDAEAKQLRIEWVDGRIGRVLVGEKGELLKCVVIGEHDRDREVERRIMGDGKGASVLGIGQRLKDGIY